MNLASPDYNAPAFRQFLLLKARDVHKSMGVRAAPSMTPQWIFYRYIAGVCSISGILFDWREGSPCAPCVDMFGSGRVFRDGNSRVILTALAERRARYNGNDDAMMKDFRGSWLFWNGDR